MNKSTNQIEIVSQILNLLQIMSLHEMITITELSKQTGLVASKVYRILQTLVALDYAHKDNYDCYGLTLKMLNISNNIIQHFEITQKALPFLKTLSQTTHETVHLAKQQEQNIVYIAKVDSPHPLRIHSYVGKVCPSYCTALGKAIFAYIKPISLVEELLNKIEWVQYTEKTIMDKTAFTKELDLVRSCGYAEDNCEHTDYMHCYGAPIFDYTETCIGGISVSTPIFRWSEEKAQELLIPELLKTSLAISQLFGYVPK